MIKQIGLSKEPQSALEAGTKGNHQIDGYKKCNKDIMEKATI